MDGDIVWTKILGSIKREKVGERKHSLLFSFIIFVILFHVYVCVICVADECMLLHICGVQRAIIRGLFSTPTIISRDQTQIICPVQQVLLPKELTQWPTLCFLIVAMTPGTT